MPRLLNIHRVTHLSALFQDLLRVVTAGPKGGAEGDEDEEGGLFEGDEEEDEEEEVSCGGYSYTYRSGQFAFG